MPADRCPECLLTPQAEELLERLEQKLRRTRPGDASWQTRICPRCGRLTAISDQVEGWSLGEAIDSGWSASSELVLPREPVLQAPQPESRTSEPAPSSSPSLSTSPSPRRAQARPALEQRRIGEDEVPTWVTVREAAFLSNVTEDTVMDWVGRDVVAHEAIVRGNGGPDSVLVRTSDLDSARSEDAT